MDHFSRRPCPVRVWRERALPAPGTKRLPKAMSRHFLACALAEANEKLEAMVLWG